MQLFIYQFRLFTRWRKMTDDALDHKFTSLKILIENDRLIRLVNRIHLSIGGQPAGANERETKEH